MANSRKARLYPRRWIVQIWSSTPNPEEERSLTKFKNKKLKAKKKRKNRHLPGLPCQIAWTMKIHPN
jgi:hypothetical protein